MIGASSRASRATLLLVLATSPAIAGKPSDLPQTLVVMPLWHPAPGTAQRPAKWLLSAERREVAPLPEVVRTSPFRNRLTTGTSTPKTAAFSTELGDMTVSLATTRAKAVRIEGLSSFAHPRFASMQADIGLGAPIGSRDMLGLAGNWALERLRPSFKAGAHNHFKSINRALTLSWVHDENLRLSLSAFDVRPLRGRSALERFSELAAGGPRAAKGIGFTFVRSASHDPDRLSFGVDLRQQRSEVDYAGGSASYRPETRGAVFLRAKF
jgi:hypothetical protein